MEATRSATITLRCERATDEAFAPFGKMVRRPENSPASLAAGAVESWSLPFAASAPTQLMFNRYLDKGRDFSVMEKHLEVTQCFFPLGGVPYIMVVGIDRADGTFTPDDVRAFYVEGDHGVLLWRHVWHSLARFPVGAPYIDLAFLTDEATQREIEGHLKGGPKPTRTAFIDFAKTHQTDFRVSDPDSALR